MVGDRVPWVRLKGASAGGIPGWSLSPRMTPMPENGPLLSVWLLMIRLPDDPCTRIPSPYRAFGPVVSLTLPRLFRARM